MCKFQIDITGDNAAIITPYNPEFVKKIKLLGGKWDGESKTWNVDARSIDSVRNAMREVYGRDDNTSGAELVSVRVTVTEGMSVGRGAVTLFGKTIASAYGRDSGARIGDGVAFTKGAPKSSGSVKNWRTEVPAGCEFILHDVAKDAICEVDGIEYEIIEAAATINREALEEEKAKLVKRLAEIEALLND
jgi:hypothetical protein